MDIFTGVELSKEQLLHFLINISFNDLSTSINDIIIDFNFDEKYENNIEIINYEHNLKCKTIEDIKDIYDNLKNISKNPFLILINNY